MGKQFWNVGAWQPYRGNPQSYDILQCGCDPWNYGIQRRHLINVMSYSNLLIKFTAENPSRFFALDDLKHKGTVDVISKEA